MKALFNGQTIAESDNTIIVEGNHYFPPHAVDQQYLVKSDTHSTCPWKGVASYYSIKADGKQTADAAWYYPSASDKAKNIENHIAFWKDVKITP